MNNVAATFAMSVNDPTPAISGNGAAIVPNATRPCRAASFGCIRMRSGDIIALYDRVHIGMHVTISEKALDELLPQEKPTLLSRAD
jgi:hypothetical protein